jgi:hypothetical protein
MVFFIFHAPRTEAGNKKAGCDTFVSHPEDRRISSARGGNQKTRRRTFSNKIPIHRTKAQIHALERLHLEAVQDVDAIEVVVGADTAGPLLLPLVRATTKPATAPTPSRAYRIVLSLVWARLTPAGAPGESGPTSPASAAEVDKAKTRKEESSRIVTLLELV